MKTIENVILKRATRPSSHVGSRCVVELREAVIGKDYGLPNLIAYKTKSENIKELYVMKVLYEDGAYLPEVVVAMGKHKGNDVAFHVGHDGSTWCMEFMPTSDLPTEIDHQGFKAFYFPEERDLRCCKACGALFVKVEAISKINKCCFCGSTEVNPVAL